MRVIHAVIIIKCPAHTYTRDCKYKLYSKVNISGKCLLNSFCLRIHCNTHFAYIYNMLLWCKDKCALYNAKKMHFYLLSCERGCVYMKSGMLFICYGRFQIYIYIKGFIWK